jgi:hypothetical protein
VLVSACNTQTPAPTVTPPAVASPTAKPVVAPSATAVASPTNAPEPSATGTPEVIAEPTVTLAPTVLPPTNIPDVKEPTAEPLAPGIAVFSDDRSNPERIIASLVNAINRKEYTRAYGYWQNSDQLTPFDQYVQGYAKTDSVALRTGAVRGSAGAGQYYYTIPAILTAKTTDGKTQTYAACYQVHLSNPGIQATPPFSPMAIQKAHVDQVANNADATATLSQICQKGGFPNDPLSPVIPSNAPDAQRYTDDRSSAVGVLRSLVNAINRKEFSRAYSYWEQGGEVAAFNDFQNGYVNTVSVVLTTGAVQSDAGAGQLHYRVPATLKAKMIDGSMQTFVGCYVLHLANPSIQSPPFQSLGITSATVKKVANNADTVTIMKTVCPTG